MKWLIDARVELTGLGRKSNTGEIGPCRPPQAFSIPDGLPEYGEALELVSIAFFKHRLSIFQNTV
ncbi:hypothetical protein [Paenibacillus peoriae]|uniref:hypothetical protein n=1 Tax=Paenibacillus peoriae TaxID=59893 RepID=UPI001C4DCDDC|nr:hypothetical protein [Paenibacillus peoriae]